MWTFCNGRHSCSSGYKAHDYAGHCIDARRRIRILWYPCLVRGARLECEGRGCDLEQGNSCTRFIFLPHDQHPLFLSRLLFSDSFAKGSSTSWPCRISNVAFRVIHFLLQSRFNVDFFILFLCLLTNWKHIYRTCWSGTKVIICCISPFGKGGNVGSVCVAIGKGTRKSSIFRAVG